MQLLIDHDVRDDAVVVRVEGEIDSGTIDEFSSYLMTALSVASSHPARLLVVNLQDIAFFGSAGMNAVLSCYERGLSQQTTVRLVANHRAVVRPIELMNLDTVLALYPSEAAALNLHDTPEQP